MLHLYHVQYFETPYSTANRNLKSLIQFPVTRETFARNWKSLLFDCQIRANKHTFPNPNDFIVSAGCIKKVDKSEILTKLETIFLSASFLKCMLFKHHCMKWDEICEQKIISEDRGAIFMMLFDNGLRR